MLDKSIKISISRIYAGCFSTVLLLLNIYFILKGDVLLTNILFFSLFFFVLFSSVNYSSYVSAYTLFLLMCFVFNYNRFLLELLTNYSFTETDLFFRYTIDVDSRLKLFLLMASFLYASFIAFLFSYKKMYVTLSYNKKLQDISLLFIYFSAPFLMYNGISDFLYVLNHGYLSIFNGQLALNSKAIFPGLFHKFLVFGLMLFLCSRPNIELFKRIMFIILLVFTINALKGQRGDIFLLIVFLCWYYYNIYNVTFSIKKGLIIVVVFLGVSQAALYFRSGIDVNVLDIPYEFLRLNGISINIPIYLILFGDELKSTGVPYLFSPISDYFYRIFVDREIFYAGPSKELLQVSNYLSYHVTYAINHQAYYFGNGTGTSYLAEFYDYGGIFFGSICVFFLVLFLIRFERSVFNSRYSLFLSFLVLSQFIYMPRDAFFKIVDGLFVYTFMYFIVILFLAFAYSRYEKNL